MATRFTRHRDLHPRDRAAFAAGLRMNRSGRLACLQVSGPINAITRRHLDDWLDWLIVTGAERVNVALTSTDQIDARLLLSLRAARARLQEVHGDLVLTAAGAPVRTGLRLIRQAS